MDTSKTSGAGIVFFVVLLLGFGVQLVWLLGFGLQFVWQWAKKEPSNDDVQAKKEPSNDDVRAKRIQATRQEHLGVQAAKTTTVEAVDTKTISVETVDTKAISGNRGTNKEKIADTPKRRSHGKTKKHLGVQAAKTKTAEAVDTKTISGNGGPNKEKMETDTPKPRSKRKSKIVLP